MAVTSAFFVMAASMAAAVAVVLVVVAIPATIIAIVAVVIAFANPVFFHEVDRLPTGCPQAA